MSTCRASLEIFAENRRRFIFFRNPYPVSFKNVARDFSDFKEFFHTSSKYSMELFFFWFCRDCFANFSSDSSKNSLRNQVFSMDTPTRIFLEIALGSVRSIYWESSRNSRKNCLRYYFRIFFLKYFWLLEQYSKESLQTFRRNFGIMSEKMVFDHLGEGRMVQCLLDERMVC